jgi:hypothetical protein
MMLIGEQPGDKEVSMNHLFWPSEKLSSRKQMKASGELVDRNFK